MLNNKDEIITIYMFDMAGRKIYQSVVHKTDEIDLTQFSSGFYFLQIQSEYQSIGQAIRFFLP